jgi:hypothetical protein
LSGLLVEKTYWRSAMGTNAHWAAKISAAMNAVHSKP